jgi:hypothetical protein
MTIMPKWFLNIIRPWRTKSGVGNWAGQEDVVYFAVLLASLVVNGTHDSNSDFQIRHNTWLAGWRPWPLSGGAGKHKTILLLGSWPKCVGTLSY